MEEKNPEERGKEEWKFSFFLLFFLLFSSTVFYAALSSLSSAKFVSFIPHCSFADAAFVHAPLAEDVFRVDSSSF